MFIKQFLLTFLAVILMCHGFKRPEPIPVYVEGITLPIKGCYTHVYQMGGKGTIRTHDTKMIDGSELYIMPMTDANPKVELNLMFQTMFFKVRIEGSTVAIQKCNRQGQNCDQEQMEGVKTENYLRSKIWNRIVVHYDNTHLTITVGGRMITDMSMLEYSNLDNPFWAVVVEDDSTFTKSEAPDLLYYVQLSCKEYHDKHDIIPRPTRRPRLPTEPTVRNEITTMITQIFYEDTEKTYPVSTDDTTKDYVTAQPHMENTTLEPKPKKENPVGLIVGLVVGGIVLLALIIVIYNVVKKKQSSFKVTEKSPLSQTTK